MAEGKYSIMWANFDRSLERIICPEATSFKPSTFVYKSSYPLYPKFFPVLNWALSCNGVQASEG